jgi:hypothetical protein
MHQKEKSMLQERKKIERFVHLTVGTLLTWVIYLAWMVGRCTKNATFKGVARLRDGWQTRKLRRAAVRS